MIYVLLLCYLSYVCPHTEPIEFTGETCLSAHNQLRDLHESTGVLEYSIELEKEARTAAERYSLIDTTNDVRPTRGLPKRKRRHVDGVDPNVHLESWDGDILFPQGSRDPIVGGKRVGSSVHKFCCTSYPHCPKRFFHGLAFPPSAKGVVFDWYNQEIGNYNFDTGKAFMDADIEHFANIVWKNTTKLGCAQSKISQQRCVYTIAVYEVEGSIGTPENYIANIGRLKAVIGKSGNVALIIFLAILFVILLIGLVVLLYCCRENIRARYLQLKIKTDTLKAEQELETDSTNFWWLRLFKRKKPKRRRTTVSRPKQMSLKERPTIELIPNTAPRKERPLPPRPRGASNAAELAIKYKGIGQKAEDYVAFKMKPLPLPPSANARNNQAHRPVSKKVSDNPSHPRVDRQPSLSGKPPPPPVPLYGNAPDLPTPSKQESTPVPQPPSQTNKPVRPAPLKLPAAAESKKPPMRPASVPIKPTNNKPTVPRKNTAPIAEEPTPTAPPSRPPPAKQHSSKPRPLVPPTRPQIGTKENSEIDEDDEKPKSVSEMRRLLEKR